MKQLGVFLCLSMMFLGLGGDIGALSPGHQAVPAWLSVNAVLQAKGVEGFSLDNDLDITQRSLELFLKNQAAFFDKVSQKKSLSSSSKSLLDYIETCPLSVKQLLFTEEFKRVLANYCVDLSVREKDRIFVQRAYSALEEQEDDDALNLTPMSRAPLLSEELQKKYAMKYLNDLEVLCAAIQPGGILKISESTRLSWCETLPEAYLSYVDKAVFDSNVSHVLSYDEHSKEYQLKLDQFLQLKVNGFEAKLAAEHGRERLEEGGMREFARYRYLIASLMFHRISELSLSPKPAMDVLMREAGDREGSKAILMFLKGDMDEPIAVEERLAMADRQLFAWAIKSYQSLSQECADHQLIVNFQLVANLANAVSARMREYSQKEMFDGSQGLTLLRGFAKDDPLAAISFLEDAIEDDSGRQKSKVLEPLYPWLFGWLKSDSPGISAAVARLLKVMLARKYLEPSFWTHMFELGDNLKNLFEEGPDILRVLGVYLKKPVMLEWIAGNKEAWKKIAKHVVVMFQNGSQEERLLWNTALSQGGFWKQVMPFLAEDNFQWQNYPYALARVLEIPDLSEDVLVACAQTRWAQQYRQLCDANGEVACDAASQDVLTSGAVFRIYPDALESLLQRLNREDEDYDGWMLRVLMALWNDLPSEKKTVVSVWRSRLRHYLYDKMNEEFDFETKQARVLADLIENEDAEAQILREDMKRQVEDWVWQNQAPSRSYMTLLLALTDQYARQEISLLSELAPIVFKSAWQGIVDSKTMSNVFRALPKSAQEEVIVFFEQSCTAVNVVDWAAFWNVYWGEMSTLAGEERFSRVAVVLERFTDQQELILKALPLLRPEMLRRYWEHLPKPLNNMLGFVPLFLFEPDVPADLQEEIVDQFMMLMSADNKVDPNDLKQMVDTMNPWPEEYAPDAMTLTKPLLHKILTRLSQRGWSHNWDAMTELLFLKLYPSEEEESDISVEAKLEWSLRYLVPIAIGNRLLSNEGAKRGPLLYKALKESPAFHVLLVGKWLQVVDAVEIATSWEASDREALAGLFKHVYRLIGHSSGSIGVLTRVRVLNVLQEHLRFQEPQAVNVFEDVLLPLTVDEMRKANLDDPEWQYLVTRCYDYWLGRGYDNNAKKSFDTAMQDPEDAAKLIVLLNLFARVRLNMVECLGEKLMDVLQQVYRHLPSAEDDISDERMDWRGLMRYVRQELFENVSAQKITQDPVRSKLLDEWRAFPVDEKDAFVLQLPERVLENLNQASAAIAASTLAPEALGQATMAVFKSLCNEHALEHAFASPYSCEVSEQMIVEMGWSEEELNGGRVTLKTFGNYLPEGVVKGETETRFLFSWQTLWLEEDDDHLELVEGEDDLNDYDVNLAIAECVFARQVAGLLEEGMKTEGFVGSPLLLVKLLRVDDVLRRRVKCLEEDWKVFGVNQRLITMYQETSRLFSSAWVAWLQHNLQAMAALFEMSEDHDRLLIRFIASVVRHDGVWQGFSKKSIPYLLKKLSVGDESGAVENVLLELTRRDTFSLALFDQILINDSVELVRKTEFILCFAQRALIAFDEDWAKKDPERWPKLWRLVAQHFAQLGVDQRNSFLEDVGQTVMEPSLLLLQVQGVDWSAMPEVLLTIVEKFSLQELSKQDYQGSSLQSYLVDLKQKSERNSASLTNAEKDIVEYGIIGLIVPGYVEHMLKQVNEGTHSFVTLRMIMQLWNIESIGLPEQQGAWRGRLLNYLNVHMLGKSEFNLNHHGDVLANLLKDESAKDVRAAMIRKLRDPRGCSSIFKSNVKALLTKLKQKFAPDSEMGQFCDQIGVALIQGGVDDLGLYAWEQLYLGLGQEARVKISLKLENFENFCFYVESRDDGLRSKVVSLIFDYLNAQNDGAGTEAVSQNDLSRLLSFLGPRFTFPIQLELNLPKLALRKMFFKHLAEHSSSIRWNKAWETLLVELIEQVTWIEKEGDGEVDARNEVNQQLLTKYICPFLQHHVFVRPAQEWSQLEQSLKDHGLLVVDGEKALRFNGVQDALKAA